MEARKCHRCSADVLLDFFDILWLFCLWRYGSESNEVRRGRNVTFICHSLILSKCAIHHLYTMHCTYKLYNSFRLAPCEYSNSIRCRISRRYTNLIRTLIFVYSILRMPGLTQTLIFPSYWGCGVPKLVILGDV